MKEAALPRTSFYNHYNDKCDLAETILLDELPVTFNYISHKFIDRHANFEQLINKRPIIMKLWSIQEIHPQLIVSLEKEFRQEPLYVAKRRSLSNPIITGVQDLKLG